MLRFLADIRDYIYTLANYRYKSFEYWIFCFGLVFFYYLGFLLFFSIFIPDWLFYYIAKHKSDSSFQQIANYIIIGVPAIFIARGFNYLSRDIPLPSKENITPKVFRRKLLNTYLFLFTGFIFMIVCIILFIKFRFQSG